MELLITLHHRDYDNMNKGPELHVTNDISSPGYIESTASSANKKSKEAIRTESLMPLEILENSEGIKNLLDAYYKFMNLDEFIYTEQKTVLDVVLDNQAVFRILDPKNKNNSFFTDEQGTDSTLVIELADGTIESIDINSTNIIISNGNNLPGSLAALTSEVGKTFKVSGLENYNNLTATLTTPIKYWVGPGPSHIMNNIEDAMNIDETSEAFLELMQKEIASVIPRNIKVDKRNLYKNIVEYYKVRGSADSIEIFFRLLFNDNVEVEYPWDKTLIPSSGNWEVNADLPKGGIYLDNKGHLSDSIKIQDSERYQKFSYLIRTGQDLSTWENMFNKLVHPAGFKFFAEILMILELTKSILGEDQLGEGDVLYRKVLSAMPRMQPGVIGIEDLPLLVEMFASVFLPPSIPKIHKSGQINIPKSLIYDGVINTVSITNSGSGYLTAPTLTSNDTGTPAGYTAASLTATIANGAVSNVTIVSGGKDYNTPSVTAAPPSAITFDGSDDEVGGVGIINITDNTIKLTTAQQEALSVDSLVTYESGGGTAIGGLVSGTQYKIAESTANKVKLKDASNNVEMAITAVGTGTSHSLTGETATFTATKLDGIITDVEIFNPGYGYATAPSITITGEPISGQTISTATVEIGIDSEGRLDIDSINVTAGGSGYKTAFGSVEANSKHGGLANIILNEDITNKDYRIPPKIILTEPTAKDADGVLLESNALGKGEFLLEHTEVNNIHIKNSGGNYNDATRPTVTIADPDMGVNLLTNSTFDTDLTGWIGSDFAWRTGGTVERVSGQENSSLKQDVSIVEGEWYQVDYDVVHTGGTIDRTTIHVDRGDGNYITLTQDGSGHLTGYFQAWATKSMSFQLYGIQDFRGYYDNVSMKRVDLRRETNLFLDTLQSGIINDTTNNSPWTAIQTDAWSIQDNILTLPANAPISFNVIQRDISFEANTNYEISLDYVANSGVNTTFVIRHSDSTDEVLVLTGTGTVQSYKINIETTTASSSGQIRFATVQDFDEQRIISNITVKKIDLNTATNGYTTDSGRAATAYATINSLGKVDNIIITDSGSGYTRVPSVTITDGGGSGATATAMLKPSQISGINIINPGNGYITDPSLRIISTAINEYRAKDIEAILIILCNHLSDASRSIPDNNYFNRKGQSYLEGTKKFDFNERLEFFSDVQIKSTDTTNINKYNVNSFIHIN